ncbi:helix-turn-helix transcriptional regulator [Mesorhizobium sp. M0047]|uniref:helix-turn-helix domain-containing protein n=1 Tax=Mesorhizobium sp. M0047 TaxID=2956859 RepID=UPI003338070B
MFRAWDFCRSAQDLSRNLTDGMATSKRDRALGFAHLLHRRGQFSVALAVDEICRNLRPVTLFCGRSVAGRVVVQILTSEQSRAARALLNWSRARLAGRSDVSEDTIREFENGNRVPRAGNLARIRRALEAAGVIFTAEGRSLANLSEDAVRGNRLKDVGPHSAEAVERNNHKGGRGTSPTDLLDPLPRR